jgi:Fe-S-cluster containining protein
MEASPAPSALDEIERQMRHASFFTQASLEQHGRLTGKLDVYVTSLIELLLARGVLEADDLARAVEANRAEAGAEARARYETDGTLPPWPTVMVRHDAPVDVVPGGSVADGAADDAGRDGTAGTGAGGGARGMDAVVAGGAPEVEVDCAARMHVCQAVCCTLPFPLSAEEVEAGEVRWDLGHPYVIRQTAEGYCVHNERPTGGCDVYDHRPGVCRGYSCAEDARIWSDFDNMVLNEEFLSSRRRPDYSFHPATGDAVAVTIRPPRRREPGAAA